MEAFPRRYNFFPEGEHCVLISQWYFLYTFAPYFQEQKFSYMPLEEKQSYFAQFGWLHFNLWPQVDKMAVWIYWQQLIQVIQREHGNVSQEDENWNLQNLSGIFFRDSRIPFLLCVFHSGWQNRGSLSLMLSFWEVLSDLWDSRYAFSVSSSKDITWTSKNRWKNTCIY